MRDPAILEQIQTFRPQVVFHLAALHFIPYCNEHPEETLDVNVRGTDGLLAALQAEHLRTFVFASSAAVYGFSDVPLRENASPRPADVYGTSKLQGEELVRRYAKQHDSGRMRVVSARLFNVYGAGDRLPHLVPHLVTAARSRTAPTIGNSWPRRDYVHVSDVVAALSRLADGPAGYFTYNVGTGVGTDVSELVTAIAVASGQHHLPRQRTEQARRCDGHLVSDPTLIESELGWHARVSLAAGLRELMMDTADVG